MKVVVTGGLGYLGSHVVKELLDHGGYQVVTLDRMIPGIRRKLFPGEEYLQADVLGGMQAEIGILKSADAVIHLAALIDAPQSVHKPELYYRVNCLGTLNTLELAKEIGAKHFLFASSAAVYGAGLESPLSEDSVTNVPENPYGGSKLFGETIVADVCRERGMSYACLRMFNLIGVNPDVKVTQQNKGLFSLAVDAAVTGGKIRVYGTGHATKDGTCVRDYVYVGEAASAFRASLEKLYSHRSFTINVGTGHGTSVMEIVDLAISLGGPRVSYMLEDPRPGEVVQSIASTSRCEGILGWKPKVRKLDRVFFAERIVRERLTGAVAVE